MKVILITEGGAKMGFGHITRCLSLCRAFEMKNAACKLIVNGDQSVRKFLKRQKALVFNWLKDKKKLANLINTAEIVFIDSYKAGRALYERIAKTAKLAVYIDDNKRLDYPEGVIVNGGIGAGRLDYGKKNKRICFLGTRFIPIRKEFWDTPKKKNKAEIKNVLVTFGGIDHRNLTAGVLKILTKEYPEWRKTIIIGSGFKGIKKIQKAKDKRTEIVFWPDALRIKKNMLAADIAISAAGQTLYELARTATPTIAIAVAKNQVNNIRGWRQAGFIEFAGSWNDANLAKKIRASINRLKSQNLRRDKSLIGRKLVDGLGAARIAGLLIGVWKNTKYYPLRKSQKAIAESDFLDKCKKT